MSDALSFAEIASQDVELLPARTVMSVLAMRKGKGGGKEETAIATSDTNSLVSVLDLVDSHPVAAT